jgi:hypothetical protein
MPIYYIRKRANISTSLKKFFAVIGAEVTSLSAGGSGSLLDAKAPAGSPLSRPPAGVFVPSAQINRVLISTFALKNNFLDK